MSLHQRIDKLKLHIRRTNLDKDRLLRLRYLKFDPALIFEWLSRDPDEWQVELMKRLSGSVNSDQGGLRTVVAASRQVGKSEFASLWICWSMVVHGQTIALTSPSFRQSLELASKVRSHLSNLGLSDFLKEQITDLVIGNGGRLITLPGDGTGRTSRGFRIDQLVIDEAAFLQNDEILAAVSPALALANGSILLVSSPGGTHGLFFDAWRADSFHKVKVRADQCSRIPPEFLRQQREMMSPAQYSREFEAEFVSDAGTWIRPEWIEDNLYDPEDYKDFQ